MTQTLKSFHAPIVLFSATMKMKIEDEIVEQIAAKYQKRLQKTRKVMMMRTTITIACSSLNK